MLRAVWAGYRATWALLRRSGRRPFGEASASHRIWIFPQFVLAGGVASLIGASLGTGDRLPALLVGLSLVVLGLALTAAVGRAADRCSFGTD